MTTDLQIHVMYSQIYANKGEDYHKNCRNWQTRVSENLRTFHAWPRVWNLPLLCQNVQNKVIFESSFCRENSYSIYSNDREFLGVLCRLFRRFKVPCLTVRLNRPIGISCTSDIEYCTSIGISCEVISHRGTSPRSGYLWHLDHKYPDWDIDCVKAFAWPVSPQNYIVLRFLIGSMYGLL
jgi:hypothetical protein